MAGPLGFYGPGRNNFKKYAFERKDGRFGLKLPVIVEGQQGVTVWIVAKHANRAGVHYGYEWGRDGLSTVHFEPCANRSPTGWPGGFVLDNLKPVGFKVLVNGSAEPLSVTVGKRKRPRGGA